MPLFHGTHNESGQGFVRILNASNRSGAVSVTAWDDAGSEFGPLTLAIDASAVRHYVANWQADRFNNYIPQFESHALATSPDGQHAYVYSEGEILIFERVGERMGEQAPVP